LTPPLVLFNRDAMHRLIPSRYSDGGTVLAEVADCPAMLEDIVLLDGATNDRIQSEQYGRSGINPFELVYGIPNWHIVNAAFTHTSEDGARFNDKSRGAWYASDEVETSLAEVCYHRAQHLSDIVVPELPNTRPDQEVSTYDDWLADFRGEFHCLEPAEDYKDCLQPEPVPSCYGPSQRLAHQLLGQSSIGLIYPSVRRDGYICLVCFRPALVYNPRRAQRMEIRLTATLTGYEYQFRSIPT
jgi:RES domain-containing protein